MRFQPNDNVWYIWRNEDGTHDISEGTVLEYINTIVGEPTLCRVKAYWTADPEEPEAEFFYIFQEDELYLSKDEARLALSLAVHSLKKKFID